MGATSFHHMAWGSSPREAFEAAVSEAVYEYGNGGYSGTIKEKDGYQLLQVPKNKDPQGFVNEVISENDKWGPAYCILLEESTVTVDEQISTGSKTEITPMKGSRKWETFYVVKTTAKKEEGFGVGQDEEKEIAVCRTQTNAVKEGRAYTEKHNKQTYIDIEKRLVNANPRIGVIAPKQKTVQKRVPKNKYLFFGYASC